ncbi:MAG: phosphoribosyl-AMP cyclohydrolase [Candidatus Omnitrophica bacterium]|nr:phosphoribosyl-AMP cyclohydrolase [Candidatus Omnitrophota bacterium]
MKPEEIQVTINNIDQLKYGKDGLIPVIVQDVQNNEVLMMAWMNQESLRRTLTDKKACYWSRSRQEFWVKGMTSGHFQYVKEVRFDCDCDCLLIKVEQVDAACHTNQRSCFYRTIPV